MSETLSYRVNDGREIDEIRVAILIVDWARGLVQRPQDIIMTINYIV